MRSDTSPEPIPPSITFGFKLLEIPSLEEVGIPFGGLAVASNRSGTGPKTDVGTWVYRGAPVLSYRIDRFERETRSKWPFAGDPVSSRTYVIHSPISGLVVDLRHEDTIDESLGLQYQWCKERRLPVLLVPDDEPLPDWLNADTYDAISDTFRGSLERIPYRRQSEGAKVRLRDALGEDAYASERAVLASRDRESYPGYVVRELTAEDTRILEAIQWYRGHDLLMRDKLAHISRAFGESI